MPLQSTGGDTTADLPPLPMDAATWQEIAQQLALPPQQLRIVELLLRGQQDKAIASELGLSFPTVRTYLKRIFERIEVSDRVGLVLRVFAMAQTITTTRCQQSC